MTPEGYPKAPDIRKDMRWSPKTHMFFGDVCVPEIDKKGLVKSCFDIFPMRVPSSKMSLARRPALPQTAKQTPQTQKSEETCFGWLTAKPVLGAHTFTKFMTNRGEDMQLPRILCTTCKHRTSCANKLGCGDGAPHGVFG